jgi:hypothetical protein
MAALKWTKESLLEEAMKYTSKIDFRKNSPNAYACAKTRKLLHEICSHMKQNVLWTKEMVLNEAKKHKNGKSFRNACGGTPYKVALRLNLIEEIVKGFDAYDKKGRNYVGGKAQIYWTLERLQEEANKYTCRGHFQIYSKGAYTSARKKGLLEQICAHMTKKYKEWNKSDVLKIARQFNSRLEFRKENEPAYDAARRMKILDEACSHMKCVLTYWTNEMIEQEAKKYLTKAEFRQKSSKAYQAARHANILYSVCQHMVSASKSDYDAVYIWKAKKHTFNGVQVYKYGLTSARLEHLRIKHVAKKGKMDAEIVILSKVRCNAAKIEAKLSKIGANPKYSGFDGCTEFRAMTHHELAAAVKIIEQNAVQ